MTDNVPIILRMETPLIVNRSLHFQTGSDWDRSSMLSHKGSDIFTTLLPIFTILLPFSTENGITQSDFQKTDELFICEPAILKTYFMCSPS